MSLALVLHTDPPMTFYARSDQAPAADPAWPALIEAGARRGQAGGEVASQRVRLDNARGDLTARFALPPLLARAVLSETVAGRIVVWIDGAVQSIELGATIDIVIEA